MTTIHAGDITTDCEACGQEAPEDEQKATGTTLVGEYSIRVKNPATGGWLTTYYSFGSKAEAVAKKSSLSRGTYRSFDLAVFKGRKKVEN